MLITTIPTDLVHDVFLMLDHRKTLAAFASTSHHFHDVFRAHPNSILRQVICNELGMDIQVLPYAWATVNSQRLVLGDLTSFPRFKSQVTLTVSIRPEECRKLRESYNDIHSLAKPYSIRSKEGRILQDTLTAEESRRFHIAACLFTNYQAIWHFFPCTERDQDDSENEMNEDQLKEADEQEASLFEASHTFLTSLSTDELFWMQDFRDFLLQDIDCVLDLKNNPAYFTPGNLGFPITRPLSIDTWRHYMLSNVLTYFGEWRNFFSDYWHEPPTPKWKELWLTDALCRVLRERGAWTQTKDNPISKILTTKGILIPACQRCGQEDSTYFNQSNIDEFARNWSFAAFPDQLAHNPVETARAYKRIHASPPPPYTLTPEVIRERQVIIREIMQHAELHSVSLLENGDASGDGLVLSENEGDEGAAELNPAEAPTGYADAVSDYKWSPGDVLCFSCFCEILAGLYYAWWLEERQTDRVEAHPFEEQCWWGTECRTQRIHHHAVRLDHCCPRTKGIIS